MVEVGAPRVVIGIGEEPDLGVPVVSVDPIPTREHTNTLTPVALAPRAPAYVYFTSGSTGTPKGILGTQLGLAHTVEWLRDRIACRAGDRVAFLRSVSFDASLREALLPFISGATMVIGPEPIDPDRALQWVADQRITVLTGTACGHAPEQSEQACRQ